MSDIRLLLKNEAENNHICLTPEMLDQFQLYADDLIKTNKVMNLTAITDPEEIAIKHFLDSLLLLSNCLFEDGVSVADVGTGAGFPGIPLKIARPDLHITLIDSLRKRLDFLQELLNKMNLTANIVHSRAEDCGRDTLYREKFDVVVARAVANLSSLAEYCLPLVKRQGCFIAMKSIKVEEEISAAQNAISLLGGRIEKIVKVMLPGNMERNFVVIRKIKSTPEKYPRRGVKIVKKPI